MQNFTISIEISIAILINSIKKIIFLSSFLAIFNHKNNILAKFSYKIIINKSLSTFISRYLEFIGLLIFI